MTQKHNQRGQLQKVQGLMIFPPHPSNVATNTTTFETHAVTVRYGKRHALFTNPKQYVSTQTVDHLQDHTYILRFSTKMLGPRLVENLHPLKFQMKKMQFLTLVCLLLFILHLWCTRKGLRVVQGSFHWVVHTSLLLKFIVAGYAIQLTWWNLNLQDDEKTAKVPDP
jgi:hypothetical protein